MLNRREFYTNRYFRRKYTSVCRIFLCRSQHINALVNTNLTWSFLIWIQIVSIGSVSDTKFLCNDCVIQEKNGFLLSYLRVEFPHTLRRDKILVNFWNSMDISKEEELVRWLVLLDWSVCGVEQRWKQKPSMIEVSEYFPESEFVISFVLRRPCLCADHLNSVSLRIYCKASVYNLFEYKWQNYSSTQLV